MVRVKKHTQKDFQKWGKLGGRPKKYVNLAEKQKAYRRRQALNKLENEQRSGLLNWTTGRINKLKSQRVHKNPLKINKYDPKNQETIPIS